MVRCGVDKNIYCEFRRNGNCENAQDPCPQETYIEKSNKKETIKIIKRHLKGIEKAVEELEKE